MPYSLNDKPSLHSVHPSMQEFLAALSERRERLNSQYGTQFPLGKFEPWTQPVRDLPGAWPADSGLHWKNQTGCVELAGGIIVLGHNWGDPISYERTGGADQRTLVCRMRAGERAALNDRWATLGNMGRTLDGWADDAGLDLSRAFFTNAFVGLKVGEGGLLGEVGIAPSTVLHDAFVEFFAHTLRTLRPRAVLTLGKPTALFLAHATTAPSVARCWAPWGGFKRVDTLGPVVHGVKVRGAEEYPFTVVALTHPSMPNHGTRRYAERMGREALVQMLAEVRDVSARQNWPGSALEKWSSPTT